MLFKKNNYMVISPFVEQKFDKILARLNRKDMELLAEMMEKGTLIPILDNSFPLSKTADAVRYSESGRARGKIVIEID